jgi:glycosyltransferase involved in cell wall biosynthesis
LKVVHVCPRFYPYSGGVETHVRELSKHLKQLGVDVEIYTTDPGGNLPKKEVLDNIEIQRFHSYPFNGIYHFSPELYSALKSLEEVDIVHAHDYQDYSVLAASRAKRKFQSPLVFTPHFHPTGGSRWRTMTKGIYNTLLGGGLLRSADAIITVSEYERDLLERRFHLDRKRIRYIPNGIDIEKFRNLKKRDHSKNSQIILYVGRLEKYKGVQHIIEALPKIVGVENCELHIVGDGNYKEELISIARRLKMTNHVTFLGKVSETELIDEYLSSDLFVMPSQYEAFCIALAEAMAYTLPVIATRVGGIPELIETGINGFLIDYPPDGDILAKKVIYLLENKEVSRKRGLEGRDHVLSRFSWRSSAEKLLEVYKDLVT